MPDEIDAHESAQIVATGGRRLVDLYWGRYVAVIADPARGRTRVLRDPTGGLPCFHVEFEGVHLYCARIEDIASLKDLRFSINWIYVAGVLCRSRIESRATGLREADQVLGGECAEHARGATVQRHVLWSLLAHAKEGRRIDSLADARTELREAVRASVRAWASCYERILFLLSGGLDSSIVLTCFERDRSPKLVCVNLHSPGSNSDERGYARLMAESERCELIEVERDPSVGLDALSRVRSSGIPQEYFFFIDEGRPEAALAAAHGATATFSGIGGDQLFARSHAYLGVQDFLELHGIRRQLLTIALDAARAERNSIWSVLGKATRAAILRRRWTLAEEPAADRSSLISADAWTSSMQDASLMHPEFIAPGRVPSGKLWHAYSLLPAWTYHNPLGSLTNDVEYVAPLLSQPLMELAMRIPTWMHAKGGWERSLARYAFKNDLPRRIAMRLSKGGQEEYAAILLKQNLGTARELLVDGYLERAGLIHRPAVVNAVTDIGRFSPGNASLFACLSTEAWVRSWQRRG